MNIKDFVNKNVPYGTYKLGFAKKTLLLAILCTVPFSIRYVFNTFTNYFTGAYSDFTSFSLYLSDIIVILIIILSARQLFLKKIHVYLFVWIVIELLLNLSVYSNLQLYFSLRLVFLVLFSISISVIPFRLGQIQIFSWIFVILGVIQSFIAIFQFYYQKSLGIYLLGESHLSADMYGVAKIVTHGTKYIRGYGTFPHSNLLAAFLVITTIINLYLLSKNYQKSTTALLHITLWINILGIFISFSRAGISAFILSVGLFFIYFLISKNYGQLIKLATVCAIGSIISVALLYPYLSTRGTITDDAVKERFFYNSIGTKIIRNKYLLGTGQGTSVLHMEQYSGEKLEPWEIQPIHNYYLIALTELGIGAILLLLAIVLPAWKLLLKIYKSLKDKTKKNTPEIWNVSLLISNIVILYLFLFDHYFYTIWQTQLLLWLIVGLTLQAAYRTGENPVPR